MKKRVINPEEKIEQVIKTARRLFLEKGFHAVTIPDIVKASGVSVGAIYLHFTNKERLATMVYQQTNQKFMDYLDEKLQDLPQGDLGIREAFYRTAELIFELTETDPEIINYLLAGRQNNSPGACPFHSTVFFQRLKKQVGEGIATGEIRPGNHFLSASAYCGVILQAVELRLNGQLIQPLPEIAGEVFENAWSSIKAA